MTGPVLAQQQFGGLQTQGTSYFTFSRPGQNTIQVLMLGDVGKPGVYEVGEDTDLGRLLALSGGSKQPGGQGGSRLQGEGDTSIRLYRNGEEGRRLILQEEMDDFVERSAYPDLQAGDVIRIESKEGFPWFGAVQFLASISTLTLTIVNFAR